MATYQLVAATGTTDANGLTTFTNRPADALGLVTLDDDGDWVPVPEAALGAGGQATSYTDAEIDAFLALKATRQELADLIGTAPAILDTFYELADWVQTDRAGVDDLLSRVNTLEIFNRFLNTDKVREGSLNRYYSDALADAGVGKYFGLDYTAEKGLPTTYQPGDIITAAFGESYVLPANTPSTPYRFALPTSSNGQLNVRGGLIGFRFEGTSGTVTIALENGVKVSGGKFGSQAQATATLTLAAGDDYKVSRGPAFIYSDEKNYKLVSSTNLFGSGAPVTPATYSAGTGVDLIGTQFSSTRLELAAPQTGSYTLQLADAGKLVPFSNTSPAVLTFPANADVALPVGTIGYLRRQAAGALSLAAGPNVVLLPPGVALNVDDYAKVSYHKIDLNTYWLEGSLF